MSASFWESVCRWLSGQEPCCSSREPGCESQDPHGCLQPVTPGPTSGLHKHCMCVAQTHACRQNTLTYKIKINKAFFFKCFILKRLLSLCLPAPVWYENPNSSDSDPDHVSCPPLPPLDIVPLVTTCLCFCCNCVSLLSCLFRDTRARSLPNALSSLARSCQTPFPCQSLHPNTASADGIQKG